MKGESEIEIGQGGEGFCSEGDDVNGVCSDLEGGCACFGDWTSFS